MFIDPLLAKWAVFIGFGISVFMAGFNWAGIRRQNASIETIEWLIQNGFLKAEQAEDGEWDLYPIDDEEEEEEK